MDAGLLSPEPANERTGDEKVDDRVGLDGELGPPSELSEAEKML